MVEDQETPSRQLVAEAMVLANSLAARFLAEHGIAGHLPQPARAPGAHQAGTRTRACWNSGRTGGV